MSRPPFRVEGFQLVERDVALVTLCGPLAEVQRLCPIGAQVELHEAIGTVADRALWGIVHNAHRQPGKRPLWSHVSELTGLGSTSAAELCAAHGCNPDRVVGDGEGREP